MPQTRPTKVKVPVNADAYNLTADLATLADSAAVVIPVASQSERDGLAALFTGGTLPVPTQVSRTDVTGTPIETWDGSAWKRKIAPIVQANTQTVGSGMAVNAFTTGTLQPIFQMGTFVGNTSSSGDLTITYPTQFPNGVIGGIGFSGDGVYIVSGTPSTVAAPTTSSLFLRFANPNGSAVASTTVRGTWIAAGW